MEEMWARGRKHAKVSKLYLRALLRRGPNIFVALAWSQVFWLVLEVSAGNEDSRGYVRISSVMLWAIVLHILAHFLLLRCLNYSHHAQEFTLDLVTDVVGFAWINVAEEMLAQVYYVRGRTALMYAVCAVAASWGAMAAGTGARDCLDWPVEFEQTANQFVAGSFALPTSWLVTQAVHIGLYGFFYRTSAANGPQNGRGKGNRQEVDVRLAASLFLLVYALLCTVVASRVLGGTVGAAVAAGEIHAEGGGRGGGHGHGSGCARESGGLGGHGGGQSSDNVLRAVEAGGPFTAALASDVEHPDDDVGRSNSHHSSLASLGGGGASSSRPYLRSSGGGSGRAPADVNMRRSTFDTDTAATAQDSLAEAVAVAARARGQSLRRGTKTYLRLTVGLMVGWAYNLWGQVEFRQKELEFRFGPALGATVYATLATALGVCIMVRGADRLDQAAAGGGTGFGVSSGRDQEIDTDSMKKNGGGQEWGLWSSSRLRLGNVEGRGQEWQKAVAALHAKRILVVVGGVSLMVGWAWEVAFDLMLEACVGDAADVGSILAKLALAVFATVAVLGIEIVKAEGDENEHKGHTEAGRIGSSIGCMGTEEEKIELLTPLIASTEPLQSIQ